HSGRGVMTRQDETDVLARFDAEFCAERDNLVAVCGRLLREPSARRPGEPFGLSMVAQAHLDGHRGATDAAASDPAVPTLLAHVGEGEGRPVVYNAHMDTMRPGDESRCTVPIHELTRKDGRLYGLGMGNMKGGLAAMCLA